jgi:hypothetical protein
MPSEVFPDIPEEPPSTQEKPWSDLDSSHNRRKNLPNEFKKIPKFGSKMHLAPPKAPKIAQLGLLAQRKILFPANREGGRAVRFLGVPSGYQVG